MHYSDRSYWVARGRAAREQPVGRASLKGGNSDADAKRGEVGSGAARLGVDDAGSGRAYVRLLGQGRVE